MIADGKIVEVGDHATLVRERGRYFAMLQKQDKYSTDQDIDERAREDQWQSDTQQAYRKEASFCATDGVAPGIKDPLSSTMSDVDPDVSLANDIRFGRPPFFSWSNLMMHGSSLHEHNSCLSNNRTFLSVDGFR